MDILDCDWKFKFRCPQTWDQLQIVDDQAVRYCETCQKNVYLCTTHQQVGHHASLGHCVVVAIPEEELTEEVDLVGMIGEVCIDDDDECSKTDSRRYWSRNCLLATLIVAAVVWLFWRLR